MGLPVGYHTTTTAAAAAAAAASRRAHGLNVVLCLNLQSWNNLYLSRECMFTRRPAATVMWRALLRALR
jgi:hypothetical protein